MVEVGGTEDTELPGTKETLLPWPELTELPGTEETELETGSEVDGTTGTLLGEIVPSDTAALPGINFEIMDANKSPFSLAARRR